MGFPSFFFKKKNGMVNRSKSLIKPTVSRSKPPFWSFVEQIKGQRSKR